MKLFSKYITGLLLDKSIGVSEEEKQTLSAIILITIYLITLVIVYDVFTSIK